MLSFERGSILSVEGGNVLGGRKSHHLRHKITLLVQNRPPDTKSPSRFVVWTLKRGYMRELGGCFCLGRVEMSWEGEKPTTYATKPPSPCNTTLPVPNRPPDLQFGQKIGFMRELGGCFCLVRVEWSRQPGTRRVETSREGDYVCGGRKSRTLLELGGRYGVGRVETSREGGNVLEGGNVTINATKSPSLCRITLPICS